MPYLNKSEFEFKDIFEIFVVFRSVIFYKIMFRIQIPKSANHQFLTDCRKRFAKISDSYEESSFLFSSFDF